jgi:hypothetical protein
VKFKYEGQYREIGKESRKAREEILNLMLKNRLIDDIRGLWLEAKGYDLQKALGEPTGLGMRYSQMIEDILAAEFPGNQVQRL